AVSVSARYRRPNSISPSVRETTIRKTMAIRLDTTWAPASTDQLRTIVISGATALGRLVQPDPDESKPGQRCGHADRERDHVVVTERRAELSSRQPVAGGLQVPDLTGPDCVDAAQEVVDVHQIADATAAAGEECGSAEQVGRGSEDPRRTRAPHQARSQHHDRQAALGHSLA